MWKARWVTGGDDIAFDVVVPAVASGDRPVRRAHVESARADVLATNRRSAARGKQP